MNGKENTMTQDLPEISYERSMNHNYMILSKCDFFGKEKHNNTDYRTRMLLENTIPGLLPVTHRLVNGESRYYYEINSLQSLDRLYEKNEIQYTVLKKLLSGCINLFERLDEYLLDGTQIIIKPELIYINVEKMQPYFVCYPDYEGDVRIAFMEFIDELLTKIDHTDERAVMLGYQVYRYTRNPNYVISEIGNLMERMAINIEDTLTSSNCQYINTLENKESKYYNKFTKHHNNTDNLKPNIGIDGISAMSGNTKEKNQIKRHACDKSSMEYSEDIAYHDTEYPDFEKIIDTKQKDKKYLTGGICCMVIALCAVSIIIEEKTVQILYLSQNSELYLFGVTAMAIAAAVLFFSCYIKKRKQDKDIKSLNDDIDNVDEYNIDKELWKDANNSSNIQQVHRTRKEDVSNKRKEKQPITGILYNKTIQQNPAGRNETVCLGDGIVEERILYGRVKGEEVNIYLDKLPMTVGTLENVADFILNDTAVSKMHVRFEEQGGRVCICDLNSTNGTVHNGVLLNINQPVMLEPGDKIRIGRTNFTYC